MKCGRSIRIAGKTDAYHTLHMNTEHTDKSKQKAFGEGALNALIDGDIRKAFHSFVSDVQDSVQQALHTPAQKYVESGKKYVEGGKKYVKAVKEQIHRHVADEAVKHVVDEGKRYAKQHKGALGLVCLYTVIAYLLIRRR